MKHMSSPSPKESKQNKTSLWFNNKLVSLLKSKKEAHQLQKGGQVAIEDYKNLTSVCRDAVRKAKVQLELVLARNVKKVFFRYLSKKQKHWEDTSPLQNWTGKLVTNNADNREVVSIFLASVFTSVTGLQIAGSSSYDNARVHSLVVEERLGCDLLQGLNSHTSLSLDRIHHWALKELTDTVARPLSIISDII